MADKLYRLRLAFQCCSAACHINTCDGKGGVPFVCYVLKLDLQCMDATLGGSGLQLLLTVSDFMTTVVVRFTGDGIQCH